MYSRGWHTPTSPSGSGAMFSSLRLIRNILDAWRYCAALQKNIIAVTTYKWHSRWFFFLISVFLKHCHSIPNQTEDKFFSATEANVSQNHLHFFFIKLVSTRLVLYHLLMSSQSEASSTRSIVLTGHRKGKRSFCSISSEIPCTSSSSLW